MMHLRGVITDGCNLRVRVSNAQVVKTSVHLLSPDRTMHLPGVITAGCNLRARVSNAQVVQPSVHLLSQDRMM